VPQGKPNPRPRVEASTNMREVGAGSPVSASWPEEVTMQLDKQEIVDLLRKEGKNEHVQKALQELPDKIDHEKHAQMLQQKFGIDPGKLAEKAIEKEVNSGATR